MLAAGTIQYELADRARGLGSGGIGAMHLPARRTGLIESIDRRLHLLKVHLAYHESDHVLNIAYHILAGGTCLEDIERRRNDEVYLDALGAQRIPAPTTAGDFCRRFERHDIESLMSTINDVRSFFYLTNDGETPADEVVFLANARCHQENLIEQLKNGVRALRMPVDQAPVGRPRRQHGTLV